MSQRDINDGFVSVQTTTNSSPLIIDGFDLSSFGADCGGVLDVKIQGRDTTSGAICTFS